MSSRWISGCVYVYTTHKYIWFLNIIEKNLLHSNLNVFESVIWDKVELNWIDLIMFCSFKRSGIVFRMITFQWCINYNGWLEGFFHLTTIIFWEFCYTCNHSCFINDDHWKLIPYNVLLYRDFWNIGPILYSIARLPLSFVVIRVNVDMCKSFSYSYND